MATPFQVRFLRRRSGRSAELETEREIVSIAERSVGLEKMVELWMRGGGLGAITK